MSDMAYSCDSDQIEENPNYFPVWINIARSTHSACADNPRRQQGLSNRKRRLADVDWGILGLVR
jgi:hypothetical protein